jgi:hypothetical protein
MSTDEWSGAGATKEPHKTISEYHQQSSRQTQKLINLTRAIAGLTIAGWPPGYMTETMFWRNPSNANDAQPISSIARWLNQRDARKLAMAERDPIKKNERKFQFRLFKDPSINWIWVAVLVLLGTAFSLYAISYLPDYFW